MTAPLAPPAIASDLAIIDLVHDLGVLYGAAIALRRPLAWELLFSLNTPDGRADFNPDADLWLADLRDLPSRALFLVASRHYLPPLGDVPADLLSDVRALVFRSVVVARSLSRLTCVRACLRLGLDDFITSGSALLERLGVTEDS